VLQLAVRSCLGACTVLQTRTLFFKQGVTMAPNVGFLATANAGITAANPSTGAPGASRTLRQPSVCAAAAACTPSPGHFKR
jgi:hypothetical protein